MFVRSFAAFVVSFAMLLPCQGQQAQIPRVGFLAPQGRSLPLFDAFRQGLSELGYEDGKNIILEARFAEGQYDRFPQLFQELMDAKVKLVAVTGAVTARAAKKSVTGIPVVFSVVVDPVADKVVPSLEHPGGTFTGVTSFDPQQARKQFELLRQVVPTVKRIAILGDKGVSEALISSATEQARAMGWEPQPIRVGGPNPDFAPVFDAIRQQHADALLVLEEPVLGVHANEIGERALKDHLPTVFAPSRVAAGGMLSYGVSQTEAIRHMAAYVDKILKGAAPGDLPVETVNRYELIVNQKTARSIGITIPADVLKKADRSVE